MTEPATTTGSNYVLDALAAEGVPTLFGLIGEGNAHLLDAVNDAPIDFRYARHEQVAVSMADGYARTTGEVGVVTLTHGPGVTNGATGIACADRDNVPLVVLVGDTSIVGRETSLQYLEHLDFTRPISAFGARVEATGALPDRVRAAFASARTERGPAVLELPGDVQRGPAPDAPYVPATRPTQRVRPEPAALEAAARVLADAEAPLVLAGGGAAASGAADAVATLAETLGAPIATTYFAKGLLPEAHPLVAGIAGTFMTPASHALVPEADAVVTVGAQLSGKVTRYGALFADASLVQIDIDPRAIGRHREPDAAVVGDARAACRDLADRLEPRPDRATDVRSAIAAAGSPLDVAFESAPDRVDPRELTAALSDRLPDGTVVTVDSGNNTGFPAVFHRIEGDGRMLVNGNFGAMGYALPAALGAQVAAPDRRVVCYIGDGAFFMVAPDIETAVRYRLPVIVVIYNDASYGIIRHRQGLDYGRETAASYGSPDFAAVAEGFGATGATVRELADLDVVDDFLAGDPDGPLVVDARTIPEIARPGFPPY